MQDFIIGQRWISEAEIQLGLGSIIEVDQRTVSLAFIAAGETRTYARLTAPLSRVAFATGDIVRSQHGWSIHIESVAETNGLLDYTGRREDSGEPVVLPEGQLDPSLQLNRPAERLFASQIDKNKWFELRYQTLQHLNRLAHTELRGLTGGRTSLIPHQLYIAHEVANRYAPRVLLADEVGLGKTIEAGLILHQQLLTERARRVLIIVPDSLVHQWLLEMVRRFNLHFSVFDEERCAALADENETRNPFHSEQLVLCSLDFLSNHPNRFKEAYLGNWDLLVVDEAHHLEWSPDGASLEYELIELLAAEINGVLLLTATPEQLGKTGHFARLRLLDPDRFPDYDSFIEEEQGYEPVARAVEQLLNEQPLDEQARQTLAATLDEGDNQRLLDDLVGPDSSAGQRSTARQQLVEHLLDRHGTGRVLFRNTRAAVKGFPARQLHAYALPMPEVYTQALAGLADDCDPRLLLCPELAYQLANEDSEAAWTTLDPRVEWLSAQLKTLRPAKVLVITANPHSAMDIAEALRTRAGIHAAVFQEYLSLIERDRAAAYFADQEFGSQVLVCSEIGSEGRNFQFAHHMILFDLPLNPDLLEQRIGRLDRIGQTQSIRIHVPYLEETAQQLLLNWYHEGLSAFEHTCPAGHNVFARVKNQLLQALHTPQADHTALIEHSKQLHDELNEAMQRGRDRLLEYNSCRPHVAEQLCEQARRYDQRADLMPYLEQVFNAYDVESEVHGEKSFVLHPGDHMQTGNFPALREEGMTVTYDRATALANEDMQFLTWEHPLLSGAMDMVLGSEQGNTAMASLKIKGLKPGSLLLECLFSLESTANTALQVSRYLPPTTIRVVLDQQARDLHTALPHATINKVREGVNNETASTIVRAYKAELKTMLAACEKQAARQAPAILAEAHQGTRDTLQTEIDRLKALAQVNPNVRADEIEFFSRQLQALTDVLDAASLRLEALRVLIST
ncbi:RNA polymerase-associated protein RapA [Sulfuriflexus sp.]|uniref:RNA polymerase-associated protein RapA n=1 Tax=Sulfuriflexus sp. TaxID=2015443 RepID=UPI0028CEA3A3|nr:RNA polymerase-associated protein RapA [Sulfuriflexus sp.]MDT8404281.1 RNA polymerase-associated protein RapA [Sulfuriflexus sp.]